MKKIAKTDFSTPKELQKILNHWRKKLGIDPIYIIQIIETMENTGYPARIDGLELDNPHPTANILMSAEWIQKNKNNEREIVSVIVHELVHILVYQAFVIIDPNYKYEGIKAQVNELLTMKITAALMSLYKINIHLDET